MPEREIYIQQITAYLDRALRAMRRKENEVASRLGMSPLQLKVLCFLKNWLPRQATVGFLAEEFEVTEPTVSDSLRVLEKKRLIVRYRDTKDRRVCYLRITPEGEKVVAQIEPSLVLPLEALSTVTLKALTAHLHQLIALLFENAALSAARLCHTCLYFQTLGDGSWYCSLLQKKLLVRDLQADCREHSYRSN